MRFGKPLLALLFATLSLGAPTNQKCGCQSPAVSDVPSPSPSQGGGVTPLPPAPPAPVDPSPPAPTESATTPVEAPAPPTPESPANPPTDSPSPPAPSPPTPEEGNNGGGSGEIDLTVIIGDCNTKLIPVIAELNFITSANATIDVLTPICGEIKSIISTTLSQVKGSGTFVIGASANVNPFAQLIGGLFVAVIGACGHVFVVIGSKTSGDVFTLLCGTASICAELLIGCAGILVKLNLSGFLQALVPIISGSISLCTTFGLTAFLKLFIDAGISIGGSPNGPSGAISLPDIIAGCNTKIVPLVAQLNFITSANATIDVLTPICGEIKAALSGAIGEIKAGDSFSLNVSGGAALSLSAFASLVGGLFTALLGACGHVFITLGRKAEGEVFALLCEVAGLAADLTFGCSGALDILKLGGFVAALLPTIQSVLSFCLSFKLDAFIKFCGVDAGSIGPINVGGSISLPDIIINCNTKLVPLVAQLNFITSANATIDVLTPICGEIKTVLSSAIADIKAGASISLNVTGGAALSLSAFASLVGGLFSSVIGACGHVFVAIGSKAEGDVFKLLCEVAALASDLIFGCSGALDILKLSGFAATLVGSIKGVLSFCLSFKLNAFIKFCGIDAGSIGPINVGGSISLPDIIGNCNTKIVPLVAQLNFITSANATIDVLTPICGEIKTVLSGAIAEIKAGGSFSLSVAGGAALSASAFASLVGGLFVSILGACGHVFVAIGSKAEGQVFDLLCEVAGLASDLIFGCSGALDILKLGGFSAAIKLNVGGVLSFCKSFKLGAFIKFCGVDIGNIVIGGGLPDLISGCHAKLIPLVAELNYITHANATVEVLTPICGQIRTVITDAIGDIKGASSVNIDVAAFASLVGGLFSAVIGACGHVFVVCGRKAWGGVFMLLCEVAGCAADLVIGCHGILGGSARREFLRAVFTASASVGNFCSVFRLFTLRNLALSGGLNLSAKFGLGWFF